MFDKTPYYKHLALYVLRGYDHYKTWQEQDKEVAKRKAEARSLLSEYEYGLMKMSMLSRCYGGEG